MVVVKTITVAFQIKVNRSIFIAVRSGTFHAFNMACHFARSLHVWPMSNLVKTNIILRSLCLWHLTTFLCSVFGHTLIWSTYRSVWGCTPINWAFAILLVNSASFICWQTGIFNWVVYLLYKSHALTLQISSKWTTTRTWKLF